MQGYSEERAKMQKFSLLLCTTYFEEKKGAFFFSVQILENTFLLFSATNILEGYLLHHRAVSVRPRERKQHFANYF